MSTAVQAASTDRVIGIDGPSLGVVRSLLTQLTRECLSPETLRDVGRSLWSVTKHATVCRIAATVSRRTGLTVEPGRPVCHDCRWLDDPATQARDERSQVNRAKTVMQAFTPSGAGAVRQATRESHMAAQIDRHRQERDVRRDRTPRRARRGAGVLKRPPEDPHNISEFDVSEILSRLFFPLPAIIRRPSRRSSTGWRGSLQRYPRFRQKRDSNS